MDRNLFISHDVFWRMEKSFFDKGAESPIFSLYRIRWKLKFEPISDKYYRGETHFEVHLIVTDAPKNYLNIKFSVSSKWKRYIGKTSPDFYNCVTISDLLLSKNNKLYENSLNGLKNCLYSDFKATDDFANCIKADNIYFVCSIKPDDTGQALLGLQEEQFPILSLPCADSLARDFEKALYNPEHTDVILKCGNKNFPAHKVVLSSRSEVFQAMFRNDLKESQEGIVNVTDIEPLIFEQLIHYIYTGNFTGKTVDSMCNMYKAAHKYNIGALKEKCIRFIKENLETHQACEVLTMADMYHETDLKTYVMNYIINKKDFLLSEEWLKFSKDYPYLAHEVFLLFVQKAEIKSAVNTSTSRVYKISDTECETISYSTTLY